MAQSKILHGARAVLYLGNQPQGIFNSCSYSMGYDVAPAWILGRFSPAELVYTGAEVVNLNLSGYRVLDNGSFETGRIPLLSELLTAEGYTVMLMDRATDKIIMKVVDAKPTGFSGSVSSRSLQEQSMTMQGLIFQEGERVNAESGKATSIPS